MTIKITVPPGALEEIQILRIVQKYGYDKSKFETLVVEAMDRVVMSRKDVEDKLRSRIVNHRIDR